MRYCTPILMLLAGCASKIDTDLAAVRQDLNDVQTEFKSEIEQLSTQVQGIGVQIQKGDVTNDTSIFWAFSIATVLIVLGLGVCGLLTILVFFKWKQMRRDRQPMSISKQDLNQIVLALDRMAGNASRSSTQLDSSLGKRKRK